VDRKDGCHSIVSLARRSTVEGHVYAEYFRGLEIDEQLGLCRLLNWKISWFLPLEDACGVRSCYAVCIRDIAAVAYKSARRDELAVLVHSGNFIL
jgi:hypothetical protein